MIHVTQHAIDRYIERIAPVDRATAHARISAAERGIEAAAVFGAHAVKTADAKLILQMYGAQARVVTVIRRDQIDHSDLTMAQRARCLRQHREGRVFAAAPSHANRGRR